MLDLEQIDGKAIPKRTPGAGARTEGKAKPAGKGAGPPVQKGTDWIHNGHKG